MPHAEPPDRSADQRALMARRLADPTLLEQAVEIELDEDGSTCLAVPLGGQRVAGQVTVAEWGQALQVLLALDGRTSFPDLRDASYGGAISGPRTIRWGLHTRHAEPRERAGMWGFHDAGVEAYATERTWRDPRIPVTPLPEIPAAPTAGRIYDLLLGGHDAYSADRELVRSLARTDTEALATVAVINRLHPTGVAARLIHAGIDQFLDLGCGLPQPGRRFGHTYPALHDLVARDGGKPRVVYADYDRSLFAISRFALEEHPLAPDWVIGDIRHMKRFLRSGRVRHLLDWSRPIGVLLHDVLPCVEDDVTVAAALETLREHLPPGSALSITHAADLDDENPMTRFAESFQRAGLTFKPRSAVAVEALFGGWPLEPPGLVPTHHWHQDHPDDALAPQAAGALAGLAFKPAC
ncbi:DUF6302 family protein [Streptomyces sp. SCSIO 30461]|uniref:DUF6302 family protein n=1 Tax=Streptomyces sp. SCSIO 30461 TaxID=3118085 RepID=UPI0030D05A67